MIRRDFLPTVSVALLIVITGLLSVHTLTSIYQDIGRHLRLGQIIWETHRVPDTNLFSYTNPDYPFINHHWFAEVLLYLGERLVGLSGLILIKALLIAGAFGLAIGAVWRPRIAVIAVVVGAVALLIMTERTDVRPEMLSFVFLGWFLFVLYRYPHSRLVWTLPLVQLIWVNSHIYFFMGPFIWVAYLIGQWRLPSRPQWIITGLMALATLCNPWGISGALYPFHIMSGYGYTIVENQSPFFLAGFGYPPLTSYAVYGGIGLMVLSFLVSYRAIRLHVFGLIIGITTTVLALMMIRNFPLFALVMLPVTLLNFDQAGWHFRYRHLLTLGIVLLGLWGLSIVVDQWYPPQNGRHFGLHVPAGFEDPVTFFRRNHLKGPMFNNFDIGSYLIWKLPEEKVFIDGRPEAYPADFIKKVYIPMQEDPTIWARYSRHYGINTIIWGYTDITPWSQAFVTSITHDPEWNLVYHDHDILILVRK